MVCERFGHSLRSATQLPAQGVKYYVPSEETIEREGLSTRQWNRNTRASKIEVWIHLRVWYLDSPEM